MPPRRAYTPPPSSLARLPVMTERTIVARRWDMIPPPGSSARFCWTLESTTVISPRVVTAAPGPSLPPRVSVTLLERTKPVPSWRSSRFSKQVWRSVWPLPSSAIGPRRLADRVADPARAQHDVARERDVGQPRVRPRRPQLAPPCRPRRAAVEQRVAVVDPAPSRDAGDVRVVAAADRYEPPLDAAVARDAAAGRSGRASGSDRGTPAARSASSCRAAQRRREAALVGAHQPPPLAATRARCT